jgi:16S rRNA (guanine527-N7)-methyltransferase
LFPLSIELLCRKNGVFLDDAKREKLSSYVDQLIAWNRKINLISRKDEEHIWESHIIHSLSPLFVLEVPTDIRLLDLGTGGGLPGIPLAIVHWGLKVTLIDSIRKKTIAVEEMVRNLGLEHVRVVNGRAEDLADDVILRGSFEVVIARAVAPLADLIRWSRPFLAFPPGVDVRAGSSLKGKKTVVNLPYLLALKGGDLQREIQEARLKSGLKQIEELRLVFPGSEALNLEDKKAVLVHWQPT